MPLQQQVSSSSGSLASPLGLTGRALWPDAVAYREAIQNPAGALTDAEMRTADVSLDRQGMPVAYSGRFAVVFRLKTLKGENWAVRCFTSLPTDGERIDRADRYRAIAGHLSRMNGFFVPYRYIEDGIRVGASFYPIVAMRWAQGRTLGRWVEDHLSDPDALRSLCGALSALLTATEEAGIAHGDWQHDNLLISDEGRSVTLVDYDGMYVPELAGLPSPELGHPNYQHPSRLPEHFGPELDRFACLVIQTALLGLARDPGLWNRFSDGESMLFKQVDFADPANSPVFRALRAIAEQTRDETFADSLARLEDACQAGPNSALLPAIAPVTPVPRAKEVLQESRPAAAETIAPKKWWMLPDAVTTGTTITRSQPAPAVTTPANTVSAATAAAAQWAFIERALCADTLKSERKHIWVSRFNSIVFVVLAVLCAHVLRGGFTSTFWSIYWIGWACVKLSNLGYSSWPRKKILAELEDSIKKMQTAIDERDSRICDAITGKTPLESSKQLNDFVKEKLREVWINRAISVPGITPSVIQDLKVYHISNALDLRQDIDRLANTGSLARHHATALRRWIQELEFTAAVEYRKISGAVGARLNNTADVARWEKEKAEFEREKEKLEREKEQFPETSSRTYFRRLIGAEKI